MNSRHAPHVVVIGGGLAGLSAAEALASLPSGRDADGGHPLRITVLESRSVTGGRAGSFLDPISGEAVDYCQHVTMGCCTNLLALLRRTGLLDAWTRYGDLTFWHRDVGLVPFRPNRRLPPPLHLHAALGRLKFLSRSQRRQIQLGLLRLMRTPEAELVNEVAENWLQRHGQDPTVRRLFWDVILISALGDLPDRVSMAAARKVMIDGFAAARGASDVWVPNRPLSEIFGRRLPAHLATLGVAIREGAAVKSVQPAAPALCGEHASGPAWQIGLRSAAMATKSAKRQPSADPILADHVILATPWHAARRLLSQSSGLESLTVPELTSSPITGLHLWFDRRLTPLPNVVLVGTLAQWLFCEPLQGPQRPGNQPPDVQPPGGQRPGNQRPDGPGIYHQVVISGRHALSDASKDQLVAAVVEELRVAFPEARSASLLRSRVVTDPHSVFSVSPGADRVRPTADSPLPTFSLAGDWVRTGWPATMEGAVISGRLAAEAVCRSWGLSETVELQPPLKRGMLASLLCASPAEGRG